MTTLKLKRERITGNEINYFKEQEKEMGLAIVSS